MPFFHSEQFSRYSHLGKGVVDIMYNVLRSPQRLLIPYQTSDKNTIQKVLFSIMLLVQAGVFLPFLRPTYLFALALYLLPRYATNYTNAWTVFFQYNAELTPMIILALIDFMGHTQKQRLKKIVFFKQHFRAITLITLSIILFFSLWATTRVESFSQRLKHYYQAFSNPYYLQRKELLEAIALVPDKASVLTHDRISAHIPQRNSGNLTLYFEVYNSNPTFPKNYQGNYILCSFAPYFTTPVSKDTLYIKAALNTYHQLKEYYIDNPSFTPIYHQKDVWLLKRKD